MISTGQTIAVYAAEKQIKEALSSGGMTQLSPKDRLTLMYAAYLRNPSDAARQRLVQWGEALNAFDQEIAAQGDDLG